MKLQETTDYLLKIVWQNITNTYNTIAAEHGLTQATGFLLINIPEEGISVSALASLIGVKSTSLSRILNSLEQDGMLIRKASDSDKRYVLIKLTEKGFVKRKVARKVVKSFNEYIDSKLSAKEIELVQQVLRKINKLTLSYKPEKYETNY